VEKVRLGEGENAPIAYYRYLDPSTKQILAYALPLEGMGLWDKVKGLMAVETDLNTVRNVSFYDQAETPGLGGRIGEAAWAGQFTGKKLKNAEGAVALTIKKSGTADVANPNDIDGITAATLTCQAVGKLMQEGIEKFLDRVKK
jgi:Na+-transporting NADH:ubiquinone oxidoreductase subunit C